MAPVTTAVIVEPDDYFVYVWGLGRDLVEDDAGTMVRGACRKVSLTETCTNEYSELKSGTLGLSESVIKPTEIIIYGSK